MGLPDVGRLLAAHPRLELDALGLYGYTALHGSAVHRFR